MKFQLIFYGVIFIAFSLGIILEKAIEFPSGYVYLGVGFGLLICGVLLGKDEGETK